MYLVIHVFRIPKYLKWYMYLFHFFWCAKAFESGLHSGVEYLLPSSNALWWQKKNSKKKSDFCVINFDKCFVRFWNLSWEDIHGSRGKKQNWCSKNAIFKAFWSADLFFPWLARMSFHDEKFQAYKTFVQVCQKNSFLIVLIFGIY